MIRLFINLLQHFHHARIFHMRQVRVLYKKGGIDARVVYTAVDRVYGATMGCEYCIICIEFDHWDRLRPAG
jgi:hypothetical protein